VIKSALYDTDVPVALTAITILTILLPIIATRAVSDLDNLVSILIGAIEWEVSYPDVLAKYLTPETDESAKELPIDIDRMLLAHSLNSVHQCINQYFTVLYGMFPCNVINGLSKFLKGDTHKSKSLPDFILVKDEFENLHNQTKNKLLPKHKQECSNRVKELVQSHKLHFDSLMMDESTERTSPWFMNAEASEIIIQCFELQVDEIKDVQVEIIENEIKSLNEISDFVLKINRFLYGPSFQYQFVINH
jgi:hypothetical protein